MPEEKTAHREAHPAPRPLAGAAPLELPVQRPAVPTPRPITPQAHPWDPGAGVRPPQRAQASPLRAAPRAGAPSLRPVAAPPMSPPGPASGTATVARSVGSYAHEDSGAETGALRQLVSGLKDLLMGPLELMGLGGRAPAQAIDPDEVDVQSGLPRWALRREARSGPNRFSARIAQRWLAVAASFVLLVLGTVRVMSAAAPSPSPMPSPSTPASQSPSASAAAPSATPHAVAAPPANPNRLTFMILGADSRVDRGRSDTLLLVHLMVDKRKIHVLSIPRDLYTKIQRPQGVIEDKVNHAYRFGGAELVKQTLEMDLGIKIDYYGVVDYDLFRKIIDTMGGVPYDVERRYYYIDRAGGLKVDLQPGPQVLDGDRALQYVRFRHDALGDIGRVDRQQKFVTAALEKLRDPKVLTYFAYMMPSLLEYVVTDVPSQMALGLLWQVKDLRPKDIQVTILPGDGKKLATAVHRQELWFFVKDEDKTREVISKWFFDPNGVLEKKESTHKKHGKKGDASPAASAAPSPRASANSRTTPGPKASASAKAPTGTAPVKHPASASPSTANSPRPSSAPSTPGKAAKPHGKSKAKSATKAGAKGAAPRAGKAAAPAPQGAASHSPAPAKSPAASPSASR